MTLPNNSFGCLVEANLQGARVELWEPEDHRGSRCNILGHAAAGGAKAATAGVLDSDARVHRFCGWVGRK